MTDCLTVLLLTGGLSCDSQEDKRRTARHDQCFTETQFGFGLIYNSRLIIARLHSRSPQIVTADILLMTLFVYHHFLEDPFQEEPFEFDGR